jgi:anti-anti-sigma regulatory factor
MSELRLLTGRGAEAGWVSVEGEVTGGVIEAVARAVDELVADGAGRVVLDVDGVTHVEARALATLLDVVDRARASGCVVEVRAGATTSELFEVAGLELVFTCLDDAVAVANGVQDLIGGEAPRVRERAPRALSRRWIAVDEPLEPSLVRPAADGFPASADG